MLNLLLARMALRIRLLGTVVATTGSVSLSATATGYARTSGSFFDDGFEKGMEIVPSGFGSNAPDVVTKVEATLLSTLNAHATQTSGAGRSLVSGIPLGRQWPLVRYDPNITGRPWIQESFVPTVLTRKTYAGTYAHGWQEAMYFLNWYGTLGDGDEAYLRAAKAVLDRFTPGTPFSDGTNAIEVMGDPGPKAGDVLQLEDMGFGIMPIQIPIRARVLLSVAS